MKANISVFEIRGKSAAFTYWVEKSDYGFLVKRKKAGEKTHAVTLALGITNQALAIGYASNFAANQ